MLKYQVTKSVDKPGEPYRTYTALYKGKAAVKRNLPDSRLMRMFVDLATLGDELRFTMPVPSGQGAQQTWFNEVYKITVLI